MQQKNTTVVKFCSIGLEDIDDDDGGIRVILFIRRCNVAVKNNARCDGVG